MTIQEIRDNISIEDKNIAKERFNCSLDYVNRILNGVRNPDTELAQSILAELEFLATINRITKGTKYNQPVEAGHIAFTQPFTPHYNPLKARTMKVEKALAKAKAKLSDQSKAA
jgi:hypothetical protein